MSDLRCVRCGDGLPPDYDRRRPCPRCLFELALDDPEGGEVVITDGGAPGPPPPTPDELAGDFPQLEIVELLGEGGMGIVYRARQRELDRDVALKILRPRADDDPSFAERFMREARAMARLSHPGIVSVHDFGLAGEHFYLLMELVEGTTLRRLIRDGELSSRQALDVVSQVCTALQFAHDEGIVHRDIKPENILIDRAGRVKIADFGLAKVAGPGLDDAYRPRLTHSSQRMGTPQYMAPEQIEHPRDVDHRADIYSLGVVFYELLTGELPLGRFSPPSDKVQVDVRLDEVVLKSLAKEPDRRYQHASDVRTELDGIQAGKTDRRRGMTAAHGEGTRKHGAGGMWAIVLIVVLGSLCCLGMGSVLLAWLFLGTSYEASGTQVIPETVPLAPEEAYEASPTREEGPIPEYEERARAELDPDAPETDEATVHPPDPPIEDTGGG